MVMFMDLPEEIIVMIIRQLDFYSLNSMYNSCISFRNLVCLHGVIKECNISMNVMATVNTLKLNFFKDISNHLLELNMCGVPDLYKTKVLPAFKKLKCLKTLDVSYTNLNILDLIEIHSVCPTLEDITINFSFGQSGIFQVSQKSLMQYQSLFEHFKNVNFVGSLNNLLSSKLALHILKKTKLHTLKLSAVEEDNIQTPIMEPRIIPDSQIPHFNHFAIYLVHWKSTNLYECMSKFPVLSMIELRNYEFFVVYMLNMFTFSVYATPIFKNFFSENFNVNIYSVTDYKRNLMGNVAIMIWNRETTSFDDSFFHTLYKHIKQYFPYIILKSLSNMQAPLKYDWFYAQPTDSGLVTPNEYDSHELSKRRRIAMPNLLLNYDSVFKENHYVQLSLSFTTHVTASLTLSPNFDFLRKLTYLSLSGIVYYTSEFFNILFRCCSNLETLNMESSHISPCAAPVARAIPLSRSLKNIRLVGKGIDFSNIFTSFSQCQTLENIHILDSKKWEHSQTADPSVLLEKCSNLYSIFIEAPFAETAQVKQLQLFNKAKERCDKHCIRVVINQVSNNGTFKYNYDPFVGVFKLNPIKPI